MLYLAWEESQSVDAAIVGPWEAVLVLRPGLVLIDSQVGRSPVYHAVKDALPAGSALAVAPLDGPPKTKGVAPGLAAWLRTHGV